MYRYSYPKVSTETNKDMMNEVQDFSMPNKNKQISSNKGKLDSMLDKLMKRKNCVCTKTRFKIPLISFFFFFFYLFH